MQPVLLSTLFFIPKGETDVVSIRFYLSDHEGLWDVETNNVYLNQQTWCRWKECKNDQHLQKKFLEGIRKVSNVLLH